MAVLRVPTLSGPDVGPYVQRTALDGVPYRLRFHWNDRAAVWVLAVHDEDDVLLAGPISLRNWAPLLRQYRGTAGMPPGELIAVAYSQYDRDAGQEELGTRVILYYLEAA